VSEDQDEEELDRDEILWRRIHPVFIPPGSDRPSSSAFQSRDEDGLLVTRATLSSINEALAYYPLYSLAALTVHQVQEEHEFRVVAAPLVNRPDQRDDLAHALIKPTVTSKGTARRLAKKCRLITNQSALPGSEEGKEMDHTDTPPDKYPRFT